MTDLDTREVAALAERLGYEFRDESLLEIALRHRSWCAENDVYPSNERLEFLGDAVLGLAVATILYREFSEVPEGRLSKVRAEVVNGQALAEISRDLGIGECLSLGRGEDQSGGREKSSLLENAFEAILGAVYLDGGWDAADQVVHQRLIDPIRSAMNDDTVFDHKSQLQEHLASEGLAAPVYEHEAAGPEHERVFTANARIEGRVVASGTGGSKKQAEQAAAEAALSILADCDDFDVLDVPSIPSLSEQQSPRDQKADPHA